MINHHVVMFGTYHNDKTLGDNDKILGDNMKVTVSIDEVIESKIKDCQRENGRCMGATSKRLREMYGDYKVTTILKRLNKRKQRGNKYQEKGTNEILNLLKQLTKTNDRMTTQSSFEL